MQSIKCRQCDLINFATAEVCRRCHAELRQAAKKAAPRVSTWFAVTMLIISSFFLLRLIGSTTAKPTVPIIWGVVFVLCVYRLFFSQKSG
jgi:uncharacterized paraquat-inducible protein A